MKTFILKISSTCLLFFVISSNSLLSSNKYPQIIKQLVQKNNFHETLLNLVTLINSNNDEKINIQNVKDFIESDAGKNLKKSFESAIVSNEQLQMPLSGIGHFLYDFYQCNIFGNHTQEIGKIFEDYLLRLYDISVPINFKEIKTSKDLLKMHRILYSPNAITHTMNNVTQLVNLIRNASIEELTDVNYLENVLLPKLGLTYIDPQEFPSHLKEYSGKGFNSWEYPIQFSKFLVSLSKLQLNNYLELGTAYRGTFIIISEYLKRFNPHLKTYTIDPHYSLTMDIYVNEINQDAQHILGVYESKRFIDITAIQWDMAFLDGDRSFERITSLYNLLKNNCNILIFQDIASDKFSGIASLWNILKKVYYKKNKIDEFTDQYEEVTKRLNKKYIGLGVIYKNILK